MAPKAGQTFVLQGESIGNDPGSIPTGTVVTVREVVKADTPGAHDGKEDAVVVTFDEPTLTMEDGAPVVGTAERAVSFGLETFSELFKSKRS